MLWAVWNECHNSAQFTFNCYRQWDILAVRDSEDGSGHFLNRKECMNQGYPLAIIAYGIGVLPLIRDLWDAHPQVTQPWYDDDAGVGGYFEQILAHFRDLQVRGPPRGYLLDPTNNILVVAPWNMARAKEFFQGMGLKVVTGSLHLGVFVGDQEEETTWLFGKVQWWAESVRTLSGVARKHLQSAFAGLRKSPQQECPFMQRVPQDIGDAFGTS